MDWSSVALIIAAVLSALIAATPPTIVAWLALKQSRVTHTEINSRMTELLKVTGESQRAEGVEQERVRQEGM